MGGKNFIGSFSYNVKDSEIIDECTRIAKQDGISFSEFVVASLKEQIAQKKVRGNPNPLNVLYGEQKEKPLLSMQSDIRQWLPRKQALEMARRISLDAVQWDFIGETCRIIAQRQRTGYL